MNPVGAGASAAFADDDPVAAAVALALALAPVAVAEAVLMTAVETYAFTSGGRLEYQAGVEPALMALM